MNRATKINVSTFGAVVALAGLEHGVGEVLQGNVAPDGILILSWPEAEFFRALSGEPAMTIIPNLLISGILTIILSLILLGWVIFFVDQKNSGWIIVLLSIALLLVGGGLFPPVLGIILGLVASRINAPLSWWRANLSSGLLQVLAWLWPWSYAAAIAAWLAMFPGISVLSTTFGVDNEVFIYAVLIAALGFLALTILAGFAYDLQQQNRVHQPGESRYR